MTKDNKISFKGKSIYLGIDNHKNSVTVYFICENINHGCHTFKPSGKEIGRYLRRNFPDGNYYSAYEAGYCGYKLHEELQSEGIKNIVINPSDVPTNDKEKKRKNDAMDSYKIARGLKNGDLRAIYIPSRMRQEDRSLVRLRSQLVKDQTRCKNRIKSTLSFLGLEIPDDILESHWSKRYIEYLKSMAEAKKTTDSETLLILIDDLLQKRASILRVTRKIRALSSTEPYAEMVDKLRSIPGISILTAMTILTEIIEIRKYGPEELSRYLKLDHLVSYVGLVPNEHSSGEKESRGPITKRGNNYLKKVIIEASWIASRKDPALLLALQNYSERKIIKTKAIIKIARKLLNRIRFILLNEFYYETMVN